MLRHALTPWALTCLVALLASVALAAPATAGQARPGSLDPRFGEGGRVVTTTTDRRVFVADAARAGRGHTVVAANGGPAGSNIYGGRLLVLRYDARGGLVRRFGRRGVTAATIPLRPATAAAVAVQADGRIIVVGSVGGQGAQDLLLVRFNADGSMDSSFGTGGIQTSDVGASTESATDVAVQPDGALVVVGSAHFAASNSSEAVVARYLPNGAPDPAFGTRGATRFGSQDEFSFTDARAVSLTREGGILVAGNAGYVGRSTIPVLARVRPDGSLDPALGPQGLLYLGGPDLTVVRDMAVEPATGRVYLAGHVPIESGGYRFFLAALRPDMSRDESFGRRGVAQAAFAAPLAFANALAIDHRRRVVLAGTAARGRRGSFAVVRFRRTGKLDSTFGRRGRVRIEFGRTWDVARGVTVGARGRLTVAGSGAAGSVQDSTGPAITLARLRGR